MAILVLGLTPATAQNSHGYLFVAPGGVSVAGQTDSTLQFGCGGERLLARGFGLGGEIGGLSPSGDLGGTVEFRDHVASPGGVTAYWWGVRFGLNF